MAAGKSAAEAVEKQGNSIVIPTTVAFSIDAGWNPDFLLQILQIK
jgi:hypothetical protein